MNALFANALRQIREFFAKLSRRDRIRLGILAVLIVVFSVALALVMGRVNYAVLYSGLSQAEAGQIMTTLKEMGITVQTQGDGTLLVPEEQVSELRMTLAADGYTGGSFNTNFIDRATGFGMTDSDRNTMTRLQMQSDIATAIKTIDKISNCLVILDLPQDSVFAKSDVAPAKASVMLEIQNGARLTQAEAYSIGKYVTDSVRGLSLDNISIVDNNMNLYSLTQDSEANSNGLGSGSNAIDYQITLREQMRESLENQVINLLAPVFGEGHVRPSVSVTLDFDKTAISSVEFAPPVEGETEGIVVSMKELYESSKEGSLAEGVPGTDSNGLGDPEYPYLPLEDDQYYGKVLRETNYEINETRTQIERAQGTIKNLSIGVLLDSTAVEEDYTEQVQSLVAQALGVGARYISVQRLPFVQNDDLSAAISAQEDFLEMLQNREFIKYGIVALTVLLLVAFILMFVRSIVRTFAPPLPVAPALAMAGAGGTVDYLAMEDGVLGIPEQEAEEIPVNVKSESVQQIEKFIERDSQAVAQLLRNWLGDDYR